MYVGVQKVPGHRKPWLFGKRWEIVEGKFVANPVFPNLIRSKHFYLG
jgi:hypothetical protein